MGFIRVTIFVWCFIAAGSISAAISQQEDEIDSPMDKARYYQAAMELARELNNDIQFYGQVVDLDGVPVADAVVKMTVRVAGAVPPAKEFNRFEVRTDEQGHFAIETFGDVIGVDEIIREGFQYHYKFNQVRNFKSKKIKNPAGPGFEPEKPFTFRVRKLAPPAFVVIHNMTFGQKPGQPSMFDLVKRTWVHDQSTIIAMQYSSNDRDWHTDVLLSVEGEPGNMRLILETPDPDSGFVIEKHEFFEEMTEAPAHGYKKKVEFPVKLGESPVTAYVKCQGGLFYARIHIAFGEDRPGKVAINATSFTNLGKGRGLEYIPGIESQYDREVYSEHTRDLVRRADLLSGEPIEMPKVRK